jgi:hypothetical protein
MALWPIFCVARFSETARRSRARVSSRSSRALARGVLLTYGSKYDRRSRLKIGEIADGGMPPTYETMH